MGGESLVNRLGDSPVLRHRRCGPPEAVLEWHRRAVAPPAPGRLLIEMIAAPINPSDLLAIRGAYDAGQVLPAVPGFEGVGRVVAGAGVPAGTRVLALRGGGTWAGHVEIPAATAIRVPDAIGDDLAAQLWINPLTVWLLLTEALAVKPGDILLANAAASAFGRALCAFGRLLEAEIVAVVRSPVFRDDLLARGAALVIDESAEHVPEAVARFARGRPVRAALDAVGGASGSALAACLPPGGTFRYYARLSGTPPRIDPAAGLDVAGFWLRRWVGTASDEAWHDAFARLMQAAVAAGLDLPVAARYPLRRFTEAVRAAQSRDRPGKVLLVPD